MNAPPQSSDEMNMRNRPVLRHGRRISPSEETLRAHNIVAFDTHDDQSRAFNLLRTQVLRDIDQTKPYLLGITSPTPAAGKSFVSINLAAALSRLAQQTVVLCDFDLRRGSVFKVLGADANPGIRNYLMGETSDLSDVIYRVDDGNLYVIPCEAQARGSSELLTSETFGQLIGQLRTLPGGVIVLCDLPPVFASDDALLAAKHLDAFLMVVEYGRNTATQVKEAMRLLHPLDCAGTILNSYRGGLLDAYGYGYGDAYGLKNYGAQ